MNLYYGTTLPKKIDLYYGMEGVELKHNDVCILTSGTSVSCLIYADCFRLKPVDSIEFSTNLISCFKRSVLKFYPAW